MDSRTRVTDDDLEIEQLDEPECLRLLATQAVGRLAVGRPGEAPEVLPVNYTLLQRSIVFRTGPGTKLRLIASEPVSFEVDFVDSFHRAGWSVLVKGIATPVSTWEMTVEDVSIEPYVAGKAQYVCLNPRSITGRRINLPVAEPMDPRGYL